tara:strand:- start:263 stop:1030 length:768 start_codon:yes stop_codon:yes gene_type:complete
MEKNLFKNKNVLITGASKGLGLTCAENFYKLGSNIFLSGREEKNLKKLKNKNKKKINYFLGDLTTERNLNKFIGEIKKKFKRIDIIIHCMGGGLGLKDPLLKKNEFLKLHQVNLGVASELNRMLFATMNKKSSFILHVGSTASVEAIGSVGYNTVKSSVVAYVKSLATYLIKKNIYVTGILPGAFIGKENSFQRLKKNNSKAYKEFIEKKLPRRKIGTSQELMPLIFLLCSTNGSMLAGSSISIDACETKAYNFY